eukprot:scaffold2544_cov401-Prasinococcus_capsulatus_cf.AAC.9
MTGSRSPASDRQPCIHMLSPPRQARPRLNYTSGARGATAPGKELARAVQSAAALLEGESRGPGRQPLQTPPTRQRPHLKPRNTCTVLLGPGSAYGCKHTGFRTQLSSSSRLGSRQGPDTHVRCTLVPSIAQRPWMRSASATLGFPSYSKIGDLPSPPG